MSLRRISSVLRLVALLAAASRLVNAVRVVRPVTSSDPIGADDITVLVPARDEADRITPLLLALQHAPGVAEVIVVDDESTDGTAMLAAQLGARVVRGAPLPAGWAGKAWALQQGIDAARTEWVVTLDADTRPDPRLPGALVARMRGDGLQFATVAGSFDCPTAGVAWLHPALLTTLVYRFGPPATPHRPNRVMANGQCMAFRRAEVSMHPVRDQLVEDVALARSLAAAGVHVAMLEAPELLTTRMYETAGEAWRGWGRSLALPGLEPRWRQLVELAIVVGAQVLPLPRLLARRGDVIDAVALALRFGTLFGTRRAYRSAGFAYWLSPCADLPAAGALLAGTVSRCQQWRGRRYSAPSRT